MKKVGIILVNYKDYAQTYLKACRDSLRSQTYSSEDYQVYIVDNKSSNQSQQYLKSIYPEAKIISSSQANYSRANNIGFEGAIKDHCDYLFTLNMDTEIDKDGVKELVNTLENNIGIGIVQAKILLYQDGKKTNRINTLGNVIHFLGFGFTSYYNNIDNNNSNQEIKGYASGCAFMIKKDIFESVGYYNEEYYMYHDDLELSLKVRLLGYRIMLVSKAIVYHKYEFSRSVKMLYYMERNRYLNIFIFYPQYLIILIATPLFLMELGLLGFSIINKTFRLRLKIYYYFLNPKTWRMISRERKKIKKISKVKFRNIAKNFSGLIKFQEIDNLVLKYIVNPIFNLYWGLIKRII